MNKVGTVAKSRLATNVYKRSRGSGEAAHRRTNPVLLSSGSHECCEQRGVRRNRVRHAQVRLRRQQRAREPSLSQLQPAHARFRRSLRGERKRPEHGASTDWKAYFTAYR